MTPRVLLDCDPGHDDAMAIIAAARYADLVGITTVAGNAPLERTTANALIVRDLLGLGVPVHSGSAQPLLGPLGHGAAHSVAVHGESGLDGADLPAPTTPLDGTDAVSFIVDTCRRLDDLWLVQVVPAQLGLRVALGLQQAGNELTGVEDRRGSLMLQVQETAVVTRNCHPVTTPRTAALGLASELDQVVALVAGDAVAVEQRGQLDGFRAGPAGLQVTDLRRGAVEHPGGLLSGQAGLIAHPA